MGAVPENTWPRDTIVIPGIFRVRWRFATGRRLTHEAPECSLQVVLDHLNAHPFAIETLRDFPGDATPSKGIDHDVARIGQHADEIFCQERKLASHPARYPAELPEYLIRMLTDAGDIVVDPFAGSCVTGEVAERLDRKWMCVEMIEDYLKGALGRFVREPAASGKPPADAKDTGNYYRVPRPGILWNGTHGAPLAADGGAKRQLNGTHKVQLEITEKKKSRGGKSGRSVATSS